MDELENKLGAILNNPQMMQQLMSMAQMMGQMNSPQPEQRQESPPKASGPSFPNSGDAAMLQRLYGIARQSGIDKNQQSLLRALSPYLSRDRLNKLEKAMRAAKIANLASAALGTGGNFLPGR